MVQAQNEAPEGRSRIGNIGIAVIIVLVAVLAARWLITRVHVPKDVRVTPYVGDPKLQWLPTRSYTGTDGVEIIRESLTAAGRRRGYVLVIPRERSQLQALVMLPHGDGGDGEGFHAGFPYERASGTSAVLVYPDGERSTWDLERPNPENADYTFVRELITSLQRRFGISPSRTFGVGYSSGGFLLNIMACRDPGLFRAIASNAGGAPYHETDTFPNGFVKCPGQKPVAMMALHGTSDLSVPLAGGAFSARYWAYVNGCEDLQGETTGYPECYAFKGCPRSTPVAYCQVEGLNHWVWERAAEVTWTFFGQAVADDGGPALR
jgi:polyhydroxybutyrate depolymerase